MASNQNQYKSEKPRSVNQDFKQEVNDKELFERANLKVKDIAKLQLKQIVEAIVEFGQTLADFELYEYELELAYRVVWSLVLSDGDIITALFARQSGKSTTLAIVIVACAILLPAFAEYIPENINTHIHKFKKGIWIGIYAPDYERAGIIGNKINTIFASVKAQEILSSNFDMDFPEKLNNYLGMLPRGSRIKIKSANKRVSIEGDTYHFLITDETQEIDDYVLKKSLYPMLSSTNGTVVHLGSAYKERVYFYDICKLNKEEDINRKKSERCHFEVPYQVVEKYNAYYKEYIKKQKAILGEYSDEFRMSYELFWALEKGMFITEDYLHKALGDRNKYVSTVDKTNIHVIGLDIAKSQDSTVVTVLEVDLEHPVVVDVDSNMVRHHKRIKNWLEIQGDDYDSQYIQICEFVDNYNWNILVGDATGAGAGLMDRLKNKYEKKGKTVLGFVFTRPDKSYGYKMLSRELFSEPPRIVFPDSDRARLLRKHKNFVNQMSNLVKTYEAGYLVVNHSNSMGKDDFPDSLMLAVYGVEEPIVGEIEEIENVNVFSVGTPLANKYGDKNFWRNK